MSRPLIIAMLLGGAVGVPYLASHSPLSAGGMWPAHTSASAPATGPIIPLQSSAANTSLPDTRYLPSIEQVLRFDITREWVYQRWARKSTWPTDVGLQAVRVQLITGTQPSALAGALTYFFNSQGAIEHISFHGRTADPAPLVAYLTRTYELAPVESGIGEQVYQVQRGSRAQSELRLRPEAVVNGARTAGSIVELELAHPSSSRYLPPRPTQLPIPIASTSPPPANSTAAAETNDPATSTATKVQAKVESYFDKVRHATPQEEEQVLWKRWPN